MVGVFFLEGGGGHFSFLALESYNGLHYSKNLTVQKNQVLVSPYLAIVMTAEKVHIFITIMQLFLFQSYAWPIVRIVLSRRF